MGIRTETLNILDDFIINKFGNHLNLNMIELGNQIIRASGRPAKEYFSGLGVNHISIDINGKDGAIPLDLTIVVDEMMALNSNLFSMSEDGHLQLCDILTNCGTVEHVKNQYVCFKNIHNFDKLDGFFFHMAPPIGKWLGHCNYYYTEEFFNELALSNNYEILENKIIPYHREHPDSKGKLGLKDFLLCIMQKKEENEFVLEHNWVYPNFVSKEDGGYG
jgi:hypothetical protein